MNALCDDGASPLYAACLGGHLEVVRYLLVQCGSDPNAAPRRPLKDTPLVASPLTIASQSGHLEIARLLIKAGGRVNIDKKDHPCPLYMAASQGHLAVCKLLVVSGALVNAEFEDSTSLQAAHENGHVQVAKYLLDNGANEKSCVLM